MGPHKVRRAMSLNDPECIHIIRSILICLYQIYPTPPHTPDMKLFLVSCLHPHDQPPPRALVMDIPSKLPPA